MIRHIGSLPISKTLKTKLLKNGIETVNELYDFPVADLIRSKLFFYTLKRHILVSKPNTRMFSFQ
jgi:hypothetical protein